MVVISRAFRPTKRDFLVIALTLTFALFLMRPSTIPRRPQFGWGWGSGSAGRQHRTVGAGAPLSDVPTFDETVQKAGFVNGMDRSVMETKLLGHSAGWTMFEQVYLFNRQIYVITDKRHEWPDLRMMTSTGLPDAPGNAEEREPKGHEIVFIQAEEAQKLWGDNVYRMRGMTYLWNDAQMIDHYYHFAAELLLSSWRVHSSITADTDADGNSDMDAPTRMWLVHHTQQQWRDGPRFNLYMMYACFPNAALWFSNDWEDLGHVTKSGSHRKAIVLDRAILADRSAAFRGPHTGGTQRTFASAVQVGNVSRWWWEPIRRQMLRFSEVSEDIIDRSKEGYGAVDPVKWESGEDDFKPLSAKGDYVPQVTYVSRQSAHKRKLTAASHEALVKELEELAKKIPFKLVIAEAEHLTKEEQVAIAGQTTILLGVHGNGLTHLLWMPPTPRSAVIEMFPRGGFARDYQWTAHALGIRHYAIQFDQAKTRPNEPDIGYPEGDDGFQGNQIPTDPKVVAAVIEARLTGKEYVPPS